MVLGSICCWSTGVNENQVLPFFAIMKKLTVGFDINLFTLYLCINGIGITGGVLISLLFTNTFTWDQSSSNVSQTKFLLSFIESVLKAPISLNKLISPEMLLWIGTYL